MYIFDIDGTLADSSERVHHIIGPNKDWDTYDSLNHTDTPIDAIITIAQALYWHTANTIMLLTGRSERVRTSTEAWLADHNIQYDFLVMRAADDNRPDTLVKLENLANWLEVNPGVQVQTIFEDRKRLVEAFRAAGYHVCQVAEGDF